jgi:hypothetical protein
MTGGRKLFTCSSCGKCFFYWVQEAVPQPKVKCYFCGIEEFPNGEPPAAVAPSVPAAVAAPQPAAAPVAVPAAEGSPQPVH